MTTSSELPRELGVEEGQEELEGRGRNGTFPDKETWPLAATACH